MSLHDMLCFSLVQQSIADLWWLQAVDNCEARFSTSQMEELLALVKQHLKA